MERIDLPNGTYFRPVNTAFESYNKTLWVLCGKNDDDRISVGWTKARVYEFVELTGKQVDATP